MYRATAIVALIGAACFWLPNALHAQEGLGFSLGQPAGQGVALTLRTIDEERLFRGSLFGQRVAVEIGAASRELEAENDRLLAELTSREAALTAQRAEMSVEEFRAAASAFDEQAEDARRTQAEKRQRLAQFEETERRRFFASSEPVLQSVLEQVGGEVLIDARAVLIARADVDITDAAISAMDTALGDGAPPPFPLTLP